MPNESKPNGPANAQDVADRVEALDHAMHELTDVEKAEWRPRQKAAVARRLGRFEDGIKRNSVKPPAA